MRIIINTLITCLVLVQITACSNNEQSIATYNQSGRVDQHLFAKNAQTNSPLEEYVSRIGKRILVVSNRPNANYQFVVSVQEAPELSLDLENKQIIVSAGLLRQLHDEAELATVLVMSMGKLSNEAKLDRSTANYLYRAGYDPQAMLDLQQRHPQWLSVIYPTPLTSEEIAANAHLIAQMPKGLARNVEIYQQRVYR